MKVKPIANNIHRILHHDFKSLLRSLPETDPLRIRYEEAKITIHIINEALGRANLHLRNIERKILDRHNGQDNIPRS